MSSTSAFKNHVFISYAHLDNQQGWIDEFHRLLKFNLDELLGEDTIVWRDPTVHITDILDATITDQLRSSAVFLSILSPRYIKSNSCLKEVKDFSQASGIRIGNKSRMLKIVKTKVPPEEHPPELHGLAFYEFYETDQATGFPRPFSNDFNDTPSYSRFKNKIYEIAYAINELIKAMRWRSKTVGSTIYIAETTSDLAGIRSQLQNSLYQSNHTILPAKFLPSLNAAELETAICEDLMRSAVSVHLIGKYYGAIPEGADRSIVDLQLELAGRCTNKERPLPRLLWVPADLTPAEQRQEEFLSYISNHIAGQPGVDLINSREALENAIRDKLKPHQKTQDVKRSNGRRRIYLVCDKPDVYEARKIQEHLAEDFEISTPLIEGDVTVAKQLHVDYMTECDAALIYYGASTQSWYQPMFDDVVYKARGYRKRKDWLAKAVYVAPPRTKPKEDILTGEAMVIQTYEPFKAEFLKPFVEKLKKAQ